MERIDNLDHYNNNNKTPVSFLHEFCTRRNISPKYDLLQVEGQVHEPTFQYRISLEYNGSQYEEMGSGRSKKNAKHRAAQAILQEMNLMPREITKECPSGPIFVNGENLRRSEVDMDSNPVGVLQELCMKLKYSPPSYEVHSEEGLPHERQFAIACKVGDHFTEIGRGKSKKLAKRMAAQMMAERLRSLPLETANSHAFDDDDDRIIEILRDSKSAKNSIDLIKGLPNFLREYRGELLDKIHEENFEATLDDPEKFLQDLAKEQKFTVIIIPIDELNANKLHQCLIQLTLEPPATLIGIGQTEKKAKLDAIHDVLQFFKQMNYKPQDKLLTDGKENDQVTENSPIEKTSRIL